MELVGPKPTCRGRWDGPPARSKGDGKIQVVLAFGAPRCGCVQRSTALLRRPLSTANLEADPSIPWAVCPLPAKRQSEKWSDISGALAQDLGNIARQVHDTRRQSAALAGIDNQR